MNKDKSNILSIVKSQKPTEPKKEFTKEELDELVEKIKKTLPDNFILIFSMENSLYSYIDENLSDMEVCYATDTINTRRLMAAMEDE